MSGKKDKEILITIVNKGRKEFYLELFKKFKVDVQYFAYGRGIASYLHLENTVEFSNEKDVIMAVLDRGNKQEVLESLAIELEENGKGAAFTIPMGGMIGKYTYDFLCLRNLITGEDTYE